ncbi:MAG: hypothetical protein EB084_16170 [Proteobacteria bacterium]|nr:hypothetical protein [Pseudomonadota bacterium]
MNRTPLIRTLAAVALICATLGTALAVTRVPPDPRGVKVVNALVEALKIQDPVARERAVVMLVHANLLTRDRQHLAPNIEQFSYKKAVGAIGLYPVPVTITEVHQGNDVTIGFQETAQRGRIDKYFVAKSQGRPAPVGVFFPADGSEPKIENFGSL